MDRKTALIELRDKVKAGDASWDADFMGEDNNILVLSAWNGSLDAAKSLHEAVLPGFAWFVQSDYRGDNPEASIEGHCVSVCFESDTSARAWLLAIIEALIDQAD
jgi:hypothetical protein